MPDLTLTETDHGKSFAVSVGSRVTISLTENPTTGYQWSLRGELSPALELVSHAYVMRRGAQIGGGGDREFVLVAKAHGQAKIELALMRAWESEDQAAQSFGVTVRVA